MKLKKLFTEPRVPYGLFFLGIILAVAVGYAAVALGQYTRSLVPITTPHHVMGDIVSSDGITLTAESFRSDTKGFPGFAPMQDYQFLMPMIDITNHTNVSMEVIPLLYFYIKDNAGNVYHPTAAPIMTDQLTGPLLPGETVREEIGFEVPLGIDHPTLYFERGTPNHPVIAIDLTPPK